MENASKALIIAGSVLIAILLISLGLAVFNSTKGTTDQADELGDMMEVAAYNRPFEQYEGTNQKGGNVKILISNVRTHNANNSSNKISVAKDESDLGKTDMDNIKIIVSQKYSVECKTDATTGKINKIIINVVSPSTRRNRDILVMFKE